MRRSRPIRLLAIATLTPLGSHCGDDPARTLPPPAPASATFSPIASLPSGRILYGDLWSPQGARLAYRDVETDSIAVFDASMPHVPPRQVAPAAYVRQVRWSPDGGWLLLIQAGFPAFASRLIAARVPRPDVSGLVVEVAPPKPEIDHGVWGSDGNIYWWDLDTGERTTVLPPSEWRYENPGPFRERTHLMPHRDRRTRALRVFVFETVPAVVEIPIDVPVEPPSGHVLGLGVVPGGRQVLLTLLGAPCPMTARANRSGAILSRYWDPCPSGPPSGPYTFEGGGSVSANRRYLIGYREVEDGHSILSSHLILTDLQATWVVDVEGTSMGLQAEFAATGLFLAYGALDRRIEIGVLDVRY